MISSACASPSQVGTAAISAVHWVSASTKTRSKNSSSGVTLSSSRSTGLSRRRGGVATLMLAPTYSRAL
jgi:hypothetical protein